MSEIICKIIDKLRKERNESLSFSKKHFNDADYIDLVNKISYLGYLVILLLLEKELSLSADEIKYLYALHRDAKLEQSILNKAEDIAKRIKEIIK